MTVQQAVETTTEPVARPVDLVRRRAEQTPDLVAMRSKKLGVWRNITWSAYDDEAQLAAHAFAALGISAADRVGVLSENRPEWLYADMGATALRAITVGFYPTSPAAEIEYLITDSGVRVIVAEDQEQVDKILAVLGTCPSVERIVYLERRGVAAYTHPILMSYNEFRELGRQHRTEHPDLLAQVQADAAASDVATLVYTSGTTGPPKGAMLTCGNIAYALDALLAGRTLFSPPPSAADVSVSFLPLCHVAERMFTVWNNAGSGIVVHFAESIETIAADLAEIQPTLLFAVPRIWEKLQSTVMIKSASASPAKRLAFRIGMKLSESIAVARIANGGDHTTASRLTYAIGYPLLFRPLRDKLGLRKTRAALSGAAPISPDVLRFFLGLGVPISEAYGMTENTAIATCTRAHRLKLGTVGEVIDGIELRLDPETGEVQTRHPGNFAGYWNRPEATGATFTEDGWLRTGDVGTWVDGTYLAIVDRMKDIIITAGGKNISPSEIENQLKVSPFVKEAVVIGDRRPYLTALIGIEFDAVADWASRKGIQYTTYRDLSSKQDVLELIRGVIVATNAKFARVENVRKFRMFGKELDHDDGELTATQKVKRAALTQGYRELIEDMYSNSTTHPGGDLQGVHT
ncbi:AMP-dependent synthetase/ligase [Nocardia sp. NPDC049149]|uniref:AMP-dependent synthetase/ligase n=1 Tax=Nocardia sp. NPDC049149 TaxID=3364315 RepID=UPI00371D5073